MKPLKVKVTTNQPDVHTIYSSYLQNIPITENSLILSLEDTFEKCLEIARRKNADYSSGVDPFRNFRNSQAVGVSPERGILVRLSDKITRISNLLDKEADVKEETINDTIEDAINYLAILKAFRHQKNGTQT